MGIEDNTDDILNEIGRRKHECLELSAIEVERAAKQICPRRTGKLARSITHEVEGDVAIVGTNVEYGLIVELGSKPHLIKPDTKEALFWPGADHPVKVVHHPGTQPKPFLRPALEQCWSKIKEIFTGGRT